MRKRRRSNRASAAGFAGAGLVGLVGAGIGAKCYMKKKKEREEKEKEKDSAGRDDVGTMKEIHNNEMVADMTTNVQK